MKKLLVLLSAALLLAACGNTDVGKEVDSSNNEVAAKEDSKQEVKQEQKEDPKQELSREDKLKERATKIIKDDFNKTTVKEIQVNKNMGLDDGSYIVLPYLKWDVKNSKKTTKEMLEMYSDHLAATLAEEGDISEITVFWEVPYHVEGDNIAKFNYTKNGDSMAIGERWYSPKLQ